MKIIYIYDYKDESKKDKIESIILELKQTNSLKSSLEIKNHVSDKIKSNTKYDIYVLVFDDIAKIKDISMKIENKERIIILTENLASSHILGCIEITPNICYTKNSAEQIARRILSVYIKENA